MRWRSLRPFSQKTVKDRFMGAQAARTDTAERMLDLAERLVQTRGFNGFSYADIARELGVTKASLHYHFPTKAALGHRLIERYRETFAAALAALDEQGVDPSQKLRAYVDLYARVLQDDRMCLCGMLAADYTTLPEPMRSAVAQFFEENERWLTAVLAHGQAAGELCFAGSPGDVARLLVSSLEGAMLVARSFGEAARFHAIAARLLADLGSPDPDAGPPAR
jgi:TetR/AcrR family transcriptional regulator, transcriptional repressor for nem operon